MSSKRRHPSKAMGPREGERVFTFADGGKTMTCVSCGSSYALPLSAEQTSCAMRAHERCREEAKKGPDSL